MIRVGGVLTVLAVAVLVLAPTLLGVNLQLTGELLAVLGTTAVVARLEARYRPELVEHRVVEEETVWR